MSHVQWHTRGDIADAEEYSGCSRLNLEHSRVLCDATLLFWLWRHSKVYWNVNVPNLRAQQKIIQSQISYEIFIVYRYYPHIHRVHKKFHLNCIRLKRRGDLLESGQIQIFAAHTHLHTIFCNSNNLLDHYKFGLCIYTVVMIYHNCVYRGISPTTFLC